jgi:miniconductance mechanosensitive channel
MKLTTLSFIEEIQTRIINEMVFWGFGESLALFSCAVLSLMFLLFLCWLSKIISQKILVRAIEHLIQKTKTEYDDYLIQHRLFHKLSHLIPAVIIIVASSEIFGLFPSMVEYVEIAGELYVVFAFARSIGAMINALHDMYAHKGYSLNRPIKGYVQMVHIIVYFVSALIMVSIMFKVSLLAVFTSLGAVAAVLLLVFKDTILGITSSIQLSANDMVKIGDWIEMPSHNADGEVIEITLYAVKVQNWNKTISTIPPYELVSKSFTNWKGMREAGARRIKRSINIDMKSVKFCTPEMLDKFRRIKYISEYIDERGKDIEEFNSRYEWDLSTTVNGRRMTNIGVFRQYVEKYLLNHPLINKELSLMVRQLQPLSTGIPIEIYAFASTSAWVPYENIQSDIFDHILAVIPEFELRVFQDPSGDDFKYIGASMANK